MSILFASLYPESYEHSAKAAPRRVNLLMTEQRGAERPVTMNKNSRPEIEKLLKEGVLTLSEILCRTDIPKSTVVKTLKDLARDGEIVVAVGNTKNIPTKHYWQGKIPKQQNLTVEQLLQNGVLSFGELVARSNSARSVVYNTLLKLQEQGKIEVIPGALSTLPSRNYWRG